MKSNSSKIIDPHGRPMNYLRLAVTDRCNLRCFYCMPENGISYLPKKEVMTFEEMLRMVRLLTSLGLEKVRITGGEPFVRKDLMDFLNMLSDLPKAPSLHLTTNGVLTTPYIPALKKLPIASINLSLDSLNPQRFHAITRRPVFDEVWECFQALMESQIPTKINVVVMEGKNEGDIIDFVKLTRQHKVRVRFIEEMPFNGTSGFTKPLKWNHKSILDHIQQAFPKLTPYKTEPFATATLYKVPGFEGEVGIIPAYSRTFCASCDRIRITADGGIKNCLYDHGVANVKDWLRSDMDDTALKEKFIQVIGRRLKDGFEAEKAAIKEGANKGLHASMSTIGG